MNYRCIPCDHTFEASEGDKPRCPKCMGIHDIEKTDAKTTVDGKRGPGRIVPGIVVLVGLIVGGLWYYLQSGDTSGNGPGDTPAGPTFETLAAELELSKPEREPCASNSEIAQFAKKQLNGKDDEEALKALVEVFQSFRKEGRWSPHMQMEPRRAPPLSAKKFIQRLESSETETPFEASSFELACALFAAGHGNVDEIQMVEILRFTDEKRPADGGGKMGRFGVTLADSEDNGTYEVYDPFTGRVTRAADVQMMSPADISGTYLGHASLSLLATQELPEARKKNDAAIKLAPSNPYHRMTRGLIFLGLRFASEALAEFEKALKMRDDPVVRCSLAEILLMIDMTGKRSEQELAPVLQSNPDYVKAHGIQAMIHMLRGEFDDTEEHLQTAERLAPNMPSVAMFWAQYYVAQGMVDEGIDKAKQAVHMSKGSDSSLLALAGLYQRTARFDEMRETLDKLVAQNDSAILREEINAIFRYDPTSSQEEEEGSLDGEDGKEDGLKLELGTTSKTPFGRQGQPSGLNLNLDLNLPSN